MTIGYIRISSEKQIMDSQRYALLTFANSQKISIDEFIEIEVSSGKSQKERRIDELFTKLKNGDLLLATEISRIARNTLECITIITKLCEMGVDVKFVKNPEINLNGSYGKLILAIFGYLAEAEKEFLKARTVAGLQAAKANGKILGRKKGTPNVKGKILDNSKEQITVFLKMGLPVASIRKLVNPTLPRKVSYNTFSQYVAELKPMIEKS